MAVIVNGWHLNTFAQSEQRKKDSFELIEIMQEFTGYEPKMWGPTMIGFGRSTGARQCFSLKAKAENLEIVFIEAKAGKSLFLHPYECENAMYLFYILSGLIIYTKDNTILSTGDCISAKNLDETEYFEINEDAKMLLVTQKIFLIIKLVLQLKCLLK